VENPFLEATCPFINSCTRVANVCLATVAVRGCSTPLQIWPSTRNRELVAKIMMKNKKVATPASFAAKGWLAHGHDIIAFTLI